MAFSNDRLYELLMELRNDVVAMLMEAKRHGAIPIEWFLPSQRIDPAPKPDKENK